MQFNYVKYLFVLVFIVVGFFIYKIFFSNNTVDDHGHLHHQAHVALHNKEYDQVIYLCDKAIEANSSSPAAYQMYIKKAKALKEWNVIKRLLIVQT